MQGFDQSQYLLVTALPGSKKSSCHSNILGTQVATHLKIQYQTLFKKSPTQRSQKSKTLEQRKSTQVALDDAVRIEQITNYHISKLKIMYVDDILTTGNTFLAARGALGCEKDACVVTLFYRPRVGSSIQRFHG